jgi:hypothetical protein
MATDAELDAATIAYLKARGWDDEIIARMEQTKSEVRERMKAALEAAEIVRA